MLIKYFYFDLYNITIVTIVSNKIKIVAISGNREPNSKFNKLLITDCKLILKSGIPKRLLYPSNKISSGVLVISIRYEATNIVENKN